MNRIEKIEVKALYDQDPDTSFLGTYTEKAEPWAICRRCGQYLELAEIYDRVKEKIETNQSIIENSLMDSELPMAERERLEKISDAMENVLHRIDAKAHDCHRNPFLREYNFFLPYAAGEEKGTASYIEYGLQDYQRMEALNNGAWHFIGIVAYATVSTPIKNGHKRLSEFTSGGLWGIESDSDPEDIQTIMNEELSDLRSHLQNFNVDLSNWKDLIVNLQLTHE